MRQMRPELNKMRRMITATSITERIGDAMTSTLGDVAANREKKKYMSMYIYSSAVETVSSRDRDRHGIISIVQCSCT
jgi:uncharacterized protein YlbG (UPF0298 family)